MTLCTAKIEEKIRSKKKTLKNYFSEYRRIESKLNNKDVPEGKKEKLKYRKNKIKDIMPELIDDITRNTWFMSGHI